MATLTINYATAATITWTTTSITNGSWRQSTAVDNTTNKYVDALVGGIIQAGTTPTAGGTFDLYVYSTYDGTNYTGGASGSDAAYTADGEESQFHLLTVIHVDATSDQDYVWGPYSVAALFGGTLPSKWGLVFENNSGVTTNATGTNSEAQFIGIKYDSA